MHREISALEGKTINMMAYGCDGGKCDFELRERLDFFHIQLILKSREKSNNQQVPSSNGEDIGFSIRE